MGLEHVKSSTVDHSPAAHYANRPFILVTVLINIVQVLDYTWFL